MRPFAIMFCLTSALWAQAPGTAVAPRPDLGRDLQAALGSSATDRESGAAAARFAALQTAAAAAAKSLGAQSLVASRLQGQIAAGLPEDPTAAAAAVRGLRSLLTQIASDLRFAPNG